LIAYIDTSALVKLLITEAGTDAVADLWARVDDTYASLICYAELRSVIAGAIRSRRVDEWTRPATRERIDDLWARVAAVDVDEPLVRAAGELSDRHGLRASDAIHLASALRIAEGSTTFVAFDAPLRDAAAAEGLIVLPELS